MGGALLLGVMSMVGQYKAGYAKRRWRSIFDREMKKLYRSRACFQCRSMQYRLRKSPAQDFTSFQNLGRNRTTCEQGISFMKRV